MNNDSLTFSGFLNPEFSVEFEIVSLEDSGSFDGSIDRFKPPLDPRTIEMVDAIITIYSIVDRKSFHLVREVLEWLAEDSDSFGTSPCVTSPVYILGNKSDLSHLRQVSSIVRVSLQP